MTFKKSWEYAEKNFTYPSKARKILYFEFDEFAKKVNEEKKDFTIEIVNSLMEGDFFILKKAYSKEFMDRLKLNTYDYFKDKPSEFYKMLEGSPDFHRKIDLETGKKYSFRACKHSFYFYPWNRDPLNLFAPIYYRWRVIKKLMGLKQTAYEKNTPKDGVIDRIQVVKYPSRIGFLEPHIDPHRYQKLIISSYMSKKDIDFKGIGFYLLDKNNDIISVEDSIDVGDMGIGMATLYHGVAPVNTTKKANWEDVNDGRWFLSLYSNVSDEVQSRHTSDSVLGKIELNENIKKKIFPAGI